MQVTDALLLQILRSFKNGRQDVRAVHAAGGQERRQTNRRALGTDFVADRIDHFPQETQAIAAGTTVFVRTSVRGGAQELVDQVAVGAVHFHAIETGVDGAAGGLTEIIDDLRNLNLASL